MAQPILAAYNRGRGLSRSSRNLTGAGWYSVSDLLRTLTAIRDNNLSYQAVRDQQLSELNNTRVKQAIFGNTTRFPAGADFVCEIYGNWSKVFQQLRAALSYKDKDNVNRGDPTKPPVNNNNNTDSASNDAFVAAMNATTTMIEKILKMEDVLDQYEFEKTFGNVWTTRVDAQPATPWTQVQPERSIGDEDVAVVEVLAQPPPQN